MESVLGLGLFIGDIPLKATFSVFARLAVCLHQLDL